MEVYIGRSRGCAGHMPPYGTQFFCFHIHFCQKAPMSGVHTPPMGNPGSTTGLHRIGRSRGVCQCTPPTGPNSFIFAYIFTEKCPRWRPNPPQNGSTPPYGKSWIRACTGSIYMYMCARKLLLALFRYLTLSSQLKHENMAIINTIKNFHK